MTAVNNGCRSLGEFFFPQELFAMLVVAGGGKCWVAGGGKCWVAGGGKCCVNHIM